MTNINIDYMNSDDNRFAKIIYNKPDKLFKRIKYYFNTVKPFYKEIKTKEVSFENMCMFSDFIKILEMVFFYHNDSKLDPELDDNVRLLSDNSIGNVYNKSLILLLEKEKVCITFKMEYLGHEETSSEMIYITCRNGFGKKMDTKYEICNGEVVNTELNQNTYRLLYNINKLLSNTMAELFLKYYKIS